jgi:ABC transport system ATP-binding/permease protein
VVKFDELHDSLTDKINVPLVGDLMASRWAFEALAVEQFARNRFQKNFFEYEQVNSDAGFKASFLIPRLQAKVELIERQLEMGTVDSGREVNLNILRNEIEYLQQASGLMPFEFINSINIDEFDPLVAEETTGYLIYMRMHFSQLAREAASDRDRVFRYLESELGSDNLHRLRQSFHNRALADMVLNRHEVEVMHKTSERLVQKKDPVYKIPVSNIGRAHFYASVKRFNNQYVDTLWFNLSVIWLMTLILYLVILIDLPRKIARFTEFIRLRKH